MNETVVFIGGLGFTVVICALVVQYLKPHLYNVLVDLCGTNERAKFWTVFSNITLMLVPIVFAMSYRPGRDIPVVFQVTNQLRWTLVGLVASVMALGIVVSRFIPKKP